MAPVAFLNSHHGFSLRHCSMLPSRRTSQFCPRHPSNTSSSRFLTSYNHPSSHSSRSRVPSKSLLVASDGQHKTQPPASATLKIQQQSMLDKPPNGRARIAIIGKKPVIQTEVVIDTVEGRKGILGIRANAYWDSIGTLPLVFAGVGIVALVVKLFKVKGGEFRAGDKGVNRKTLPKYVITSEEEEKQLHVFKCGGCGYEMYPARGREDRFFPDGFKCPLCGTPRDQFWDLNDPDDPRNQTDDDEEDEDDGKNPDDDDDGGDGDGSGSGSGERSGNQSDSSSPESKPAVSAPGAPVQVSADVPPSSSS